MTEMIKPNLPEQVPSTSSCKRLIKHAWIFGPKYWGWSKIVCVNVFYYIYIYKCIYKNLNIIIYINISFILLNKIIIECWFFKWDG